MLFRYNNKLAELFGYIISFNMKSNLYINLESVKNTNVIKNIIKTISPLELD